LVVIVGTSGCITKEPPAKELATKLAEMPLLELETVDSYEKFSDMADKFNDMTRLLNNEGNYHIREIEVTEESYQKISRVLTEYGPLINNYNRVVKSAKDYDGSIEKEQVFYTALGSFTLETLLITTAVFGSFTYEGIGVLYRASGLNIIAPSCPTCVSIILGNAHWFVRTCMVEKSSETAEQILNGIELSDEIKAMKQMSQPLANETINTTRNIASSLDKIRYAAGLGD
jgi:chromatin segregation and condensation protein Rec8/ScpA/Scc1 (kleisin family)